MNVIIGLAGVKTSGKSTVCNMFREFIKADESALADKLKNVSAEVFGLERNQFDAQELKEVPFDTPIILTAQNIADVLNGFNLSFSVKEFENLYGELVGTELSSPRRVAQFVGTEILRATGDEDIHCDNVTINENNITIISDLRFPNEYEYFQNKHNNGELTFIPLYVQRDEAEKHVTEDSHPSEKGVFIFSDKCIKIDNNGTFSNTEGQVKSIVDTYNMA